MDDKLGDSERGDVLLDAEKIATSPQHRASHAEVLAH